MGMFADYVRRARESEPTVRDQSLSGEVSAGLRGAGNAIAGQVNSLAGLAAENLGADEFAAARRKSAGEYMQRAGELGEGAVELDDALDSPRNALRWGARTAGSVLPYLGLTALGTMAAPAALGTGIARGIAGGTLGMSAPAAGAIVQRQEADPEAMLDTPGERLGRAGVGGVLSGGAMSLPFGNILGKVGSGAMMGVGKRVAASPSILGATAKNLGSGAATAGIGMGGGNVIEQGFANPDADIDWQEAGQMAKEGAAMGALLHAPLIPGAYMRGRANQAGDAIGAAKDRVVEGMKTEEGRWQGFSQAADIASDISKSTWNATKKAMPEGWKESADEAGAWVRDNYKSNFEAAKKQTTQWAKDIAASENIPADIKARVASAATNLRDRTNQAYVATTKFASERFNKPVEEAVEVKPRAAPFEKLNEIRDVDRTDTADMAAVAKGEPLGGIKQYAGKTADWVNEKLNLSENQTLQKVQKWGTDLLNDNGLNPAERARIGEAMKNHGDAAAKRVIAESARASEVSKKYLNKAIAFADSLRKKPDDGVQQSADLEGFRSALQQGVIPYLSKNMPELFLENGQEFRHVNNLRATAEVLQNTIRDMSRGEMSSTQMAKLIDMLGEHTMPVMERLMTATGRSLGQGKDVNRVYLDGQQRAPTSGKGAMGENNTMQDQLTNLMRDREPVPSDPFTEQFMTLARLANKDAEISQMVRHGLTPEWQERLTMDDVRTLGEKFTEWAGELHLTKVSGSRRGAQAKGAEFTAIKDPNEALPAGKAVGGKEPNDAAPGTPLFQTEAGLYKEKAMREAFADYFGENADRMSEAFEKQVADRYLKEPTPMDRFDADGNRIEEAELERVVRGGNFRSKSGNKGPNEEGQVKKRGQHQADADGKMIREPDQIESKLQNPANWYAGGMKGPNKAHQLILDTEAEFPAHRVFWEQSEGAAKGWGYIVAEREKVAGRLDHNDIENMKADRSVSADGIARTRKEDLIVVKTPSGARIELDSMRAAWTAEKNLPYIDGENSAVRNAKAAIEAMASIIDKFGRPGEEIKIDPNARVGILGKDKRGDTEYLLWKDVKDFMDKNSSAESRGRSFDEEGANWRELAKWDEDKARELSRDPAENQAESLSTKSLRDEGRYQSHDGDNIHVAAADRGGKAEKAGENSRELMRTSDENGNSVSSFKRLSATQNAQLNKLGKTLDFWYEVGTPAARTLVEKADILAQHTRHAMSAADLASFLSLRDQRSPAKGSEIVNRLYDKYYAILPEDLKGTPPKAKFEASSKREALAKEAEGSPDPKAPAAKKAALLKAASSSDPALLTELATSTDVKGLQRTVGVLADAYSSRLTERVAAKVGPNKFRQLTNDMDELLNYSAEKDNFSRAILRENPVIKAGLEKLYEGRRAGDAEATAALHSYLQKEHQFFGLENARDTQAAVVKGLNMAKPRALSGYMDIVINAKDVPAIMREVARAIKKVSPDTMVSSVADMDGLGAFNTLDNTIKIRGGLTAPTQVLLHEGVHAATLSALVKNPELGKAVRDLMDHVVSVNKELVDAYGLHDTGEFMAEGLTNRGFQKSLESIPASDAVRKYLGDHIANAWQAFVAITRRAIGLPEGKDTALSQLLELGRQAMHETKEAPNNLVSTGEYMGWMSRPTESVGDLVKSVDRVKARLPDKAIAAELDALITTAEREGGAPYATVFAAERAAQVFDNWARRGQGVPPDIIRKTVDAILGAHLDMDQARVAARSGEERAIDAANKRIAELIEKTPDIAYGMQLESKKSLNNNSAGPHGPLVEAKIQRFARKVLGPTVDAALVAMGHAGEFRRDSNLHVDVLRVSTTAQNPLGVAHHEALHAFFGHLRNAKMNDVTHLLEKYSASPHIMKQLRERLKSSPEALEQLRTPEERAAYMFQFYKTDRTFKIMPQTRTLFGKINDMLHNVLGLWTNQERAIEIMDYFNRGDFARDMGNMDTVHAKLMETHRIAAVEVAKKHVDVLGRLGDSMLGMGGHRLRDTGIPALIKIADLVKSDSRAQGGDRGHLPAAREAHAQVMNKYADEMSRYTNEEHAAALEAMQNGVRATGRARQVQLITERTLGGVDPTTGAFTGMFGYMVDKGVDIGLLKDKNGAHYFPRVWDAHYVSKNQAAFLAMMDKYVQSGDLKGDPRDVMRNIMAGEGGTFGIETRQPGMQFKKERLLHFIDHADAAQFLNKNLLNTVDNYVTQGTRRAEWAARFGDDASILAKLLKQAEAEGATPLQIMQTETYLRGIDGTLGDTIDPGLRRMFGNAIIYQNIRLLPLALFSSLVDPLGIAVRGGTAKQAFGAFAKGIKEIPNGFRDVQNRKISPEERTAELLGVIDNAWLHSTMGSLYTQGLVGETGRKINDTFFKYNMMEGFNRSMRAAATAASIKFIELHADGKASPHSARWMQELGFGVGADSAVHLKADGSLKLTEADGLTPAQAAKVKQAVNQWVDGAILRPDAADKPMWMNDPHWALVAHLKQFTWSFQETVLKRVGHEWRNGNFSPALAMASYIPMMMAADAAKGLIQGGGSQPSWKDDWGPAEYFWSATQRAGVFGVSQLGIDSLSSIRQGGAGIGNLAGPMFEQLGDGVSVIGGRKQFDSFAMRAMPANAVYSEWVKDGGEPPPALNFEE